ncbi:MAG: hypothetical protein R3C11_14485 [Planctomycetaceae bacterium]
MPGRISHLFVWGVAVATLSQGQLFAQWYGANNACNPCQQQVAAAARRPNVLPDCPRCQYTAEKMTVQKPVVDTVWR